MKKGIATFLLLIQCVCLPHVAYSEYTAAEEGVAEEYYINLLYSNRFDPDELNYKAASRFAEMVTERTDGHVTVEYYGMNEQDCYKKSVIHVVEGENWIGLEEPSILADWVGDCAVLVGPMLYNNDEEYNYIMESEPVKHIKESLAKANIHVLDTHYTSGFRSVFTNFEIHSPSDLNGKVLRCTPATLEIRTVGCLGAKPMPMSFIGCLTAISNGDVDGFEGFTSTLAGSGAPYELVKKVSLTKHFIESNWLFMAQNVYEEMPEKWRDILDTCALECGMWEQNAHAEEETELIRTLETEYGIAWNDVDIDAFTVACAPVFDWIAEEYGAEPNLYHQLIELIYSYRSVTE